MKKIVFLDIDGVLNSMSSLIRGGGSLIDPNLVERVNRLCADCGAEVVISSSWGFCEDTVSCLRDAGATFNIIGGIDHQELYSPWLCRGNAIARWLFENFDDDADDYEYVILDDSQDFLMSQSDNLVVTNQDTGVSDRDIDMCKRILLANVARMCDIRKVNPLA